MDTPLLVHARLDSFHALFELWVVSIFNEWVARLPWVLIN